jgi:CTP:molybdopterin cytidylyltransferase MocA
VVAVIAGSTGLLLAAGAGRRMGRPKALVRRGGTPWITHTVRALQDGGCHRVVVVVGAAAAEVRAELPPEVSSVVAEDWHLGLAHSLRAGLTHLRRTDASGALIMLVDLPDIGAEVVARVLGSTDSSDPQTLARACYRGVPGHPVLLGRAHWDPVIAGSSGRDTGAQDYLEQHQADRIECGDLATGRDLDTPADLSSADDAGPG